MMPLNNFITTDKTIRRILLSDLEKEYGHNSDTAIIPELSLPNGLARIDIAVVNGIMHGYELKSDFDSLFRLQRQMTAYNYIFDKITLVVGKRHLVNALNVVPEWWGITIARSDKDKTKLIPIRKAFNNPDQDIRMIVNMLWKEEMLNVLYKKGASKKLQAKTKETISEILVNSLTENKLKRYVRHVLIERSFNSMPRFDAGLRQYDG